MSDNALSVSGLRYRTPAGERGPFDLIVHRGEVVLLCLDSAQHPQAFLEVLATLDRPLAGRLVVAGEDAAGRLALVRERLAYLPPEGGYTPSETVDEMLRRVARWRRVPAANADRARERFERWAGQPWPRREVAAMPARARALARLAVFTMHGPALLLACHPFDRLPAADRPDLAAALAQVAADGAGLLLCDGSLEAALLAERIEPRPVREGWVVAARWEASTADLQRQVAERGWSGRWQVGLRGGSCRLGPFESSARAREAAVWLMTTQPHPTAIWCAPDGGPA